MESNLKMIYDSVCSTSGYDLSVKTRKQEIVYFRQIYFYFAKRLTKASLKRIGSFVKRDHSTVLYGIRKYEENIFYSDYKKLSDMIQDKLPMFLENDKNMTVQEREIRVLKEINAKLREENENLKTQLESKNDTFLIEIKERENLKNHLESKNDAFLIEISQLPEEQRNEFRDYKWRPHKRMLESRINNENLK